MSGAQPSSDVIPFRCLVVQLSRLGDTLQSLMALRAAKQLYPSLEIHFVAKEPFAAAAQRVPWLSSVTVLPTERLITPILHGKKTETQIVSDLAQWIAPLTSRPWDLVINWSYSEASSFLTALIPAHVKLGFSRRNDGTMSAVDGWSHYVQAVVQQGTQQNIHVTDILTTQLLTALQIHLGDPADPGNETATSKTFFSLELQGEKISQSWKDHNRKWVGIQLSGSNPAKTWDPEAWAGVAQYILARHPDCNVVLLGNSEDKIKADRFFAKIRAVSGPEERILSLVGQTDFDLWATVIGRCQWLMATDTAAIHLASILGTRVLNIAVGPTTLMQTGPYGNGHYVIQAERKCAGCMQGFATHLEHHTCRADISVEAVYSTWAYASSEWSHRRSHTISEHFGRLGFSKQLSQVLISRSRVRASDEGGGVVFDCQQSKMIQVWDWAAQAIGSIARAWYCGWIPPLGHELKRESLAPSLVAELRKLKEGTAVLAKVCDEAQRTAIELENKASKLVSTKLMNLEDRRSISSLANKLTELDALMERIGKTQSVLSLFSAMNKVLMHNLTGDDLAALGKESAISYDQLKQGVSLLDDCIEQTLALSRPIALVRPVEIAIKPTEVTS